MTREKLIAVLVSGKVEKRVLWASICVGVRLESEQDTTVCTILTPLFYVPLVCTMDHKLLEEK